MTGGRQVVSGIFMAILFSTLVLGSFSLSLLEGGYALAEAPTPAYTIAFSGQQVVSLVGTPASQGALTETPAGGLVIYTPTALACSYPAGWVEIVASPDSTLGSLAQAYGLSVDALKAGNCMTLISSLIPGSFLHVPPVAVQIIASPTLPIRPSPTVCRPPYGWVTYIVRPGDNLAGLAAAVQMNAWSLQAANCLGSAYLYSGQALALPYYPIIYPTATYRPPATYWFTPWASPTYGPSPTFPWLPTHTPTPPFPPLTTWTPIATVWTPGPTDTVVPPTAPPPASDTPVSPPTQPPPTLLPPPSDTPVSPPTQPPPTQLPPPSDTPAPPPTQPPPPTELPPTQPPPPTEPPPPTATADTGFPFP